MYHRTRLEIAGLFSRRRQNHPDHVDNPGRTRVATSQHASRRALSETVAKDDPQNVRAETVKGYAQLKEGDLKAAEKTFYNMSRSKGEGQVMGKEGLSQVYAQKGEPAKAMKIADEIESQSGDRVYAHVVKGDLLYSQNKIDQAETEYRKAIGKSGGAAAPKAVAYNQLGRMYALEGDYPQSRKMYDEAVALDPFYVEATSNKGLTYERQGEWGKALEAYRRAKNINRNDPFAAVLAAHAERMMIMEKDPNYDMKSKRGSRSMCADTKRMVAAGRFQSPGDPWTSGTTVMTIFEPFGKRRVGQQRWFFPRFDPADLRQHRYLRESRGHRTHRGGAGDQSSGAEIPGPFQPRDRPAPGQGLRCQAYGQGVLVPSFREHLA